MPDEEGFCDGDPGADHRLTIMSDDPAEYTLSFGSWLRPGVFKQVPNGVNADPDDLTAQGRVPETTQPVDGSHVWIGDGPIRLVNRSDVPLFVSHDNRGEQFGIPPGGVATTSCPTEKRRKLALGTVAGGVAALAAGTVR